MTRKLYAVGVILLSSVITTRPILACGDKISNAARGIWRGSQPLGKQQAILIVLGPDVTKALPRQSQVEADLVNEGFNPTWVYRPEEITAKLKERKWDLVIAGPSDVDAAAAAQGQERIFLVALGTSNQQKKKAEKKYSWVVTKVAGDYFVDDVADALEASVHALKKTRGKAG